MCVCVCVCVSFDMSRSINCNINPRQMFIESDPKISGNTPHNLDIHRDLLLTPNPQKIEHLRSLIYFPVVTAISPPPTI